MLRVGAQQLIQQAVEAELQDLLAQYAQLRTAAGTAGVVRNGYQPERDLQTSLGPVAVKIPKVRSKTGKPVTFRSALVPPYIRKTRTLEAALPRLYLKGVSEGCFQWGDGLCAGGFCRAGSKGPVGQYRVPVKADLGARLSSLEREAPGSGPLGIPLGRRRLQRAEGRTNQTVRPGDYRCE